MQVRAYPEAGERIRKNSNYVLVRNADLPHNSGMVKWIEGITQDVQIKHPSSVAVAFPLTTEMGQIIPPFGAPIGEGRDFLAVELDWQGCDYFYKARS